MVNLWKKYSFAILFIILSMLMGLYLIFSTPANHSHYVKITVKAGDTLWSISEQYAKDIGMDTAEFVKLLERENQLAGKWIKSGETITIPMSLYNSNNKGSEYAFETE